MFKNNFKKRILNLVKIKWKWWQLKIKTKWCRGFKYSTFSHLRWSLITNFTHGLRRVFVLGFRYSCRPWWVEDAALSLEDGEVRAEQPALQTSHRFGRHLTNWRSCLFWSLELSILFFRVRTWGRAQLSPPQHSLETSSWCFACQSWGQAELESVQFSELEFSSNILQFVWWHGTSSLSVSLQLMWETELRCRCLRWNYVFMDVRGTALSFVLKSQYSVAKKRHTRGRK